MLYSRPLELTHPAKLKQSTSPVGNPTEIEIMNCLIKNANLFLQLFFKFTSRGHLSAGVESEY